MGSGYLGYTNTEGARKRLKPPELMQQLKKSGVKYSEKNVVMITKNYEGKLMWLEMGNANSGLIHILNNHRNDFKEGTNIPLLLKKVLELKPIRHTIRNNGKNLADVFIYIKEKKRYLVAYGDNGYIVSFYPVGRL